MRKLSTEPLSKAGAGRQEYLCRAGHDTDSFIRRGGKPLQERDEAGNLLTFAVGAVFGVAQQRFVHILYKSGT